MVLAGSIAQGDLDGEKEQDTKDGEEESVELADAADVALQLAAAADVSLHQAEMAALWDLMTVDMGTEPEQDGSLVAKLLHALWVCQHVFWPMVHRFAVVRLCKALLFALRAVWIALFFMCPGE